MEIGEKLVLTYEVERVQQLRELGYEPIECSIGGESIVGPLEMDHHGERSHLEGVAIRAYRDFFGARKNGRFVTTGPIDADACFATAALMGILPHPSRAEEFESHPPYIQKAMTQDLSELAETINLIDTNPIGLDLCKLSGGNMLKLWNSMTSSDSTSLGYQAGVSLWASLTTGNPEALNPFLQAATAAEVSRIEAGRDDLHGSVKNGLALLVLESKAWAFDVWYGRRDPVETESEKSEGWEHPVVLAWVGRSHEVTIGCPNDQVAEELFGEGGLKNVFPVLDAISSGWGGREAIGGSPRGRKMTRDEVHEALSLVAVLLE